MEFFRTIDVESNETDLRDSLKLNNLEQFSNLMFSLGESTEANSPIGGLWGEFTLRRSPISGGIRFDLMECPNALAWTITTGLPPVRDAVVIHLTINRQEQEQVFMDEINEFLDDHTESLYEVLSAASGDA